MPPFEPTPRPPTPSGRARKLCSGARLARRYRYHMGTFSDDIGQTHKKGPLFASKDQGEADDVPGCFGRSPAGGSRDQLRLTRTGGAFETSSERKGLHRPAQRVWPAGSRRRLDPRHHHAPRTTRDLWFAPRLNRRGGREGRGRELEIRAASERRHATESQGRG